MIEAKGPFGEARCHSGTIDGQSIIARAATHANDLGPIPLAAEGAAANRAVQLDWAVG